MTILFAMSITIQPFSVSNKGKKDHVEKRIKVSCRRRHRSSNNPKRILTMVGCLKFSVIRKMTVRRRFVSREFRQQNREIWEKR